MMKNIYTIAGTLLLLGVVLSCSKEKVQEPVQDAQMRFAVTVEGTTKASMTSADLNQFYLKVTGPNNAFSFYDTIVKEGETWKASSKRLLWKDEESSITYAAASYGALGPDYLNVPLTDAAFASGSTMGLLTDQGTQEKLNAADLLTMKETTLAFADTEDGVVPVTLRHGLAKANFKLTLAPEYFDNGVGLEASPITGLALGGVHTSFFFSPLTGEVSIPDGASKGAVIPFQSSYEPGTEAAKTALAVAEAILVPEAFDAGALTLYFTVAGKDFTWTNSTPLTFEQGGEYEIPVSVAGVAAPVTPDPGDTVLDGALSGKFSVSATKQVNFSKGNLRYASGTWSFFDNQYDNYTSYSADAWDKFGWSTSATTYGMNTSKDNSTYSGNFVDWGATMGTGWFTLSKDEWVYLFNTRTTATTNMPTGTNSGAARYTKATVAGVSGVILFPDNYAHPAGVTVTVSNAAYNTGDKDYTTFTVDASNWVTMQSEGCVFLPVAGYRNGTSLYVVGSQGYYWSSTANDTDAYYMYFHSGTVNPASSSSRKYGTSVRLVYPVE